MNMPEEELMAQAKELGAPFELLKEIHKTGKLPVVNFAAGGVATPADAALMMQLGADGVFVGSGIFKASNPEIVAKAIVKATTHYKDPQIIVLKNYWHLEGGNMRIGVLAAQGAFAEHIATLDKLQVAAIPVRLLQELKELDGLIIPGGESTSISHLMLAYNLMSEIRTLAESGFPIFGTCAGMILLARNISDADGITPLGVMDLTVRRNAFGRQVDSFETELKIPALGEKPFPGIFIRAPLIEQAGSEVEILATLADGNIVAVRQGNLLAAAFHPELTGDSRFHRYFLDIVTDRQ